MNRRTERTGVEPGHHPRVTQYETSPRTVPDLARSIKGLREKNSRVLQNT
ncbi:unnamed protein product [Spirodela intermedia]|uniref:Uncharacterized protein n=1 Tax=Spirodela intermedia TaxID=51605 RepID=A0A7I8KIP5_SPIIN|nr:unnamed protein product [Spirodela intermedia]